MKKIKLFIFLLITVAALVVVGCNDNEEPGEIAMSDSSILEIAQNTPELSSLTDAIERANLTSTFEGSTVYTVMAPNNTAFGNFLGQKGYSSIDQVPVDSLSQILLNHVITSRVEAATLIALGKNYTKTLANGPSEDSKLTLFFDATNGVVFNGNARVIEADIPASNGLLHIVDQVIDLPSLSDLIFNLDEFDDLESALDILAASNDLPSLLNNDVAGPFTLFSPINEAFDELLAANPDWSTLEDIDETLLTAVLSHHVSNGNRTAFDLEASAKLTSLEGDEVLLSSNSSGAIELTDGAGNSDITVIASDLQAINGVAHLIDKVLLPNTEN